MPKNFSGKRIQCKHCGYTWFTHSQNPITSCPHCGYRVRNFRESRVNQPAADINTPQQKQYY